MAAYTELNLPADPGLVALFRSAGVGPGGVLPDEAELRAAVVDGARDAQSTIDALVSAAPGRDGWTLLDGRWSPPPVRRLP